MTAEILLAEVRSRGIRVEPRPGGKLRLAPKGRLTPDLIDQARAHKAELLAALAPTPQPADSQPHRVCDREEEKIDRVARTDGWSPPSEIPGAVSSEIAPIEPAALALGWTRERLWNFQFWPHTREHPRGLAAVIDPGDKLVEITAEWIGIEKGDTRRTRIRFYRTDS